MIGKLLPHAATFRSRSQYVQYGKQTQDSRAAWTVLRNLEGAAPDFAHVVMQATAKQNTRVQKPSGHLIVSWAKDDALDDPTRLAIIDQTMADLGLAEHQAMYVAHDDTDHFHVHIIYNRIHPETLKAAPDSHERLKLRASLVRQEQDHGLVQTRLMSRGRHQRSTHAEIQIAARDDRDSLVRMSKQRCDRLREELAYCFKKSYGWASFHSMLKRRGYDLTKAGPGARIVRHFHYAKLSDVLPPELNAKRLQHQWGKFTAYWETLEPEDQRLRRRQRQKQSQRQIYLG